MLKVFIRSEEKRVESFPEWDMIQKKGFFYFGVIFVNFLKQFRVAIANQIRLHSFLRKMVLHLKYSLAEGQVCFSKVVYLFADALNLRFVGNFFINLLQYFFPIIEQLFDKLIMRPILQHPFLFSFYLFGSFFLRKLVQKG